MPEPLVAALDHRVRELPLPRPWGPDVPSVHVVVLRVTDSDGAVGEGFSWSPQTGAGAVAALLAQEVAGAVVGGPTAPEPVWERLRARLHEGGPGLTAMAAAAVDIALWDLRARRFGVPLVELLGRRRDSVPVYGSGVNLHYPVEDLVAQAERVVAGGYAGIKVKVGKPDLAEDLDRVGAVREAVGPGFPLMVDANQRWDLPAARRAVAAFADLDPYWIEEPLLAEDLRAHADLRAHCPFPIAIGENLRTIQQFRDALVTGACDIVQPNVVRVGGITGFRRVAELADAFGARVTPHLLPDLSGQLALTLPGPTLVEDVEDASFAALGALSAPSGVRIADGALTADTGPGHGLRFADDAP